MMKNIFLPTLFITLLVFINSCTKESCNEDIEVYMRAVFYSSESGEKSSIDSLDIYGLNISDSLICSMATLNNIDLPLDPAVSNCSFAIVNGGRADTIQIYYESNLIFVSAACGYIYLHELEEVLYTTNDIINIVITNKPVNPGDEENIQIFY
ncbi:MAG: hypothetical protein JW965_02445 [Bacteroidales bacterium]|nr:hypothetical protein [Bacteroidales bacterium]